MTYRPSIEDEKVARLKLFRFGCSKDGGNHYQWEQKKHDFQWLRDKLADRELGEIIYLYVNTWDFPFSGWSSIGEEITDFMTEAIQLGYVEPSAFHLRAQGFILAGNYGMAVKDIEKALTILKGEDNDLIIRLLCDQAQALCSSGRFNEAYQVLLKARDLDEESMRLYILLAQELEERILCEYALKHAFYEPVLEEPESSIVKILTLWRGRSSFPTLDGLEKEFPGILQYLKEITGEDLWVAMKNNPSLTFTVRFPQH